MVLSSWQSNCESSPGSSDECRMAPSGRWPKTKPVDLRPVYSDTTQLNSTELNSTAWTTVDSVCRSWHHKQKHDWLGCTLFNWVSWVRLSCVDINTPLGCEFACTGCQSLHPPSPFIIITQLESWYSFYRPTEGRRLSRPAWFVTYRDGLPAHRWSPILVLAITSEALTDTKFCYQWGYG